jgi:hypothetical protein
MPEFARADGPNQRGQQRTTEEKQDNIEVFHFKGPLALS